MKKLLVVLTTISAFILNAQNTDVTITKSVPKITLDNTGSDLYSSSRIDLKNETTSSKAFYQVMGQKMGSGNNNEGFQNFVMRKNVLNDGYYSFLTFQDNGNHLRLNVQNTSAESVGNTIIPQGDFIVGDEDNSNGARMSIVSTGNQKSLFLKRTDVGQTEIRFQNANGDQGRIRFGANKQINLEQYNGSSWVKQLNLSEDGNFGIGMDAGANWKMQIDGKLRAEEIKVEILNGSDFVFEDGYELRSLEETEAYIKANKHLPEIPSAAEMEADGVEVGELNMLFLMKIEELTLYTIEQQKMLKKQQALIEAQGKMIEELLNRD